VEEDEEGSWGGGRGGGAHRRQQHSSAPAAAAEGVEHSSCRGDHRSGGTPPPTTACPPQKLLHHQTPHASRPSARGAPPAAPTAAQRRAPKTWAATHRPTFEWPLIPWRISAPRFALAERMAKGPSPPPTPAAKSSKHAALQHTPRFGVAIAPIATVASRRPLRRRPRRRTTNDGRGPQNASATAGATRRQKAPSEQSDPRAPATNRAAGRAWSWTALAIRRALMLKQRGSDSVVRKRWAAARPPSARRSRRQRQRTDGGAKLSLGARQLLTSPVPA